MIAPVFPSNETLRPWLDALEKSPPGASIIIAIDLPASQNFPRIAWGLPSAKERAGVRRALLAINRKRSAAGEPQTTEVPLLMTLERNKKVTCANVVRSPFSKLLTGLGRKRNLFSLPMSRCWATSHVNHVSIIKKTFCHHFMKYPTTDKEIALFWGIAARTLFRWKADGAPLRDEAAMQAWLATRKNLPRSMLEKLKLPHGKNLSSPVSGGTAGAAAALKRLQEAELAAFERLQAAIATGNPLLIKEAREGWTKLCESLRKYELLVEQSRREAGDMIPRAALQQFVKHFYVWTRTSLKFEAEHLTNRLIGKSEIETYGILCEVFSHNLFNTILSYMAGPSNDARLVESARQFLESAYLMSDEQIERYLELWLRLGGEGNDCAP